MHVEMTCVEEMYAGPEYPTLLAEFVEYKDKSVYSLKTKYLLSPRAREEFHRLEQLGFMTLFRAMHEGKLIGIISVVDLRIMDNTAMIESLYVLKAYRKTGAANALVRAAKEFCKTQGMGGVIFTATPDTALDKALSRKNKLLSKTYYVEL